jgi:hypothetical protein
MSFGRKFKGPPKQVHLGLRIVCLYFLDNLFELSDHRLTYRHLTRFNP